jgi:prepilin-type processing-associated H-X9-DG protein
MRSSHRPGFTLFQLLSLLALLGLLFALLLPAVVKVKRSAQLTRSFNNMKQLGLACHNYHDVYKAFPPGNDKNNFSAAARLLPYIEQDNVYKTLDFSKPITDAANATARKLQIPVFMSPLDTQPVVDADFAPTNYLFNAGPEPALAGNKGGVFYQDSKVTLTQIANADGTSFSLMLGETLRGDGGKKATEVKRQHVLLGKGALDGLKDESGVQDFKDNKHIAADRCFRWVDGRFLQGTFTGTRVPNDMRPDVSCDGLGGLCALRSLEGTINVGFCDGSVRTFRKPIALDVWKNLTSWNDGNVINLNALQ